MHLVPNLPKQDFRAGAHMKLYVGGLQGPWLDILDKQKFHKLPIQIIDEPIPNTRHIVFVRHLESKYNEYKKNIVQHHLYQEFMQAEEGELKAQLAYAILQDFFAEVGIDYETGLSDKGHQDGEKLSLAYAKLIKQNPSLFPDIIYVSPYLRTRLTAHYLLKNIEGLEIDFDKLICEDKLQDLIIGSFHGREVCIKTDETIRERDHGSNIAPSFIREYWDREKGIHDLLTPLQKEEIYYYTSPAGGESQVQTNARAKDFLTRNFKKEEFGNILVVSHHLTMIGALLSIFGGSFQTFYQLNKLRKPDNASFTFLSQIPETEAGAKDKFRISGYNLSLVDDTGE